MPDIIVIGGGPAGLSAAITARQRNHSVAVISNDRSKSGLYRAKKIDNYPGLHDITGPDFIGEQEWRRFISDSLRNGGYNEDEKL